MNKKELSEMTLKELWELFPIIVTDHLENAEQWYNEEKAILSDIISDDKMVIHHIGSTYVKTIKAKPIIDIIIEFDSYSSMKAASVKLTDNGYNCMSENENRISLNKGYTKDGFAERVFHIHLRLYGDNDELYFRDYLIDFPDIAKEYEKLKLSLCEKYKHNRNAYTDAKHDFICCCTKKAKSLYKNKYDI